jgi:MFS family permease
VVNVLANVGIGLFISAPYLLITAAVEAKDRPKFFGFIATFNAIGALSGPLLAGILIDLGFASAAFLAYAPIVVIAVILVLTLSPKTAGMQRPSQAKFDFLGLILLVFSISCLVLWISLGGRFIPWFGLVGVTLLVIGIAAFIGLVVYEGKQVNPVVSLSLFRKKRFTTAFLCVFVQAAYTTSAAGYTIVYVQQIMQAPASVSSTVTMPQTIVMLLLGLVLGSFLKKNFAGRIRMVCLTATVCSTAGSFLLFSLQPASPMAIIYLATAIGGVAVAISQTAFTPFFQTELQPQEYGAAQGLYGFANTGGSCVFGSVASAVMNMGYSINTVYLVAAILCTFGLIVGFIGFRMPASQPAQTKA